MNLELYKNLEQLGHAKSLKMVRNSEFYINLQAQSQLPNWKKNHTQKSQSQLPDWKNRYIQYYINFPYPLSTTTLVENIIPTFQIRKKPILM